VVHAQMLSEVNLTQLAFPTAGGRD
jgi:hypothetical protein